MLTYDAALAWKGRDTGTDGGRVTEEFGRVETPARWLAVTGWLAEHLERADRRRPPGRQREKRGFRPPLTLSMYLAVLRLIQDNVVIRAWYAKKLRRQGWKKRSKAVVAIMRKLVLALWHVARGSAFDARRLFNTERLSFSAAALAIVGPDAETS